MRFRVGLLVFFFLKIAFFECLGQDSISSEKGEIIISSIRIEGNKRTKNYFILREIQFKINDTIPKAKINEILETDRKKIINTNLFITVKLSTKPIDNQRVEVLIEVKERLYFIGVPVFYLADRNFNEWWYERNRDLNRTIYGVLGRHFNLTGNGDQLRVRAEAGFIPNFELSYGRPYVDKALKTGIWAGVVYISNKTMAYRTWNDKLQFLESETRNRQRWTYYTAITRRTGFYQNQMLELSYNVNSISDTIASLNPHYLLNSTTKQKYFLASYTYTFDRRDNQQYALKGYRFSATAIKYGLFLSDDINQLSLVSSFAYFIPLGKKFYSNFSVKAKVSFPQKQPYLQTLGLGYRNDLVRGYELYVIDGQNFSLLKTNLKYQIFDKIFDLSKFIRFKKFNTIPMATYLNSFLDFGYVKNHFPENSNTKLGNSLLVGGGLGLDVVSWYNIVGRLNYSFNKMNEKRLFFTITRDF